MKRGLLVSIFVFSLATNLAVGGTLLWNWWRGQVTSTTEGQSTPSLTRDDLRVISAAWPSDTQATMRETRERVRQKMVEILELIARNPGDLAATQPKIDELIALRGQMERQALQRISSIMAQLPQESRTQF
ncbi:MAG: periplasmic heavy metal sensor, partial [Deltaproteobacteria bacterium]|nr:periplasmic heavy metal sensor [Deltaproteobacteria bacterium]